MKTYLKMSKQDFRFDSNHFQCANKAAHSILRIHIFANRSIEPFREIFRPI